KPSASTKPARAARPDARNRTLRSNSPMPSPSTDARRGAGKRKRPDASGGLVVAALGVLALHLARGLCRLVGAGAVLFGQGLSLVDGNAGRDRKLAHRIVLAALDQAAVVFRGFRGFGCRRHA